MTKVMTTDRCPICGYEGFRDNRIHIVNGELCLLRQNAALWRRIDGVTFRSDGCGAREVADDAPSD